MALEGPSSAMPASVNNILPRTSIHTRSAAATIAAATVNGPRYQLIHVMVRSA